eukprot:13036274-Alexandrium_andersonii.AAC.1
MATAAGPPKGSYAASRAGHLGGHAWGLAAATPELSAATAGASVATPARLCGHGQSRSAALLWPRCITSSAHGRPT